MTNNVLLRLKIYIEEGILCALESAHAIAGAQQYLKRIQDGQLFYLC